MTSGALKFPLFRAVWLCCALVLFLSGQVASARLGVTYQTALGNPDGASASTAERLKYLITARTQYALSYNDDTHQVNWASWSYSLSDDGSTARTDAWKTEELLPSGYLKIGTASFGSAGGISFDRGHMCPSGDRTLSTTDNQTTFRMSNIIPQAGSNNQGLWAQFEDYCRTMAADGDEVLIISGPARFTGSRLANQMSIPGSVWKIAVEVKNANGTATPANQLITTSSRVIAIMTPNVDSGLGSWQSYITSVEAIEDATGFNFFTALDPSVAIYLKNVVDTGTGPNSPTVVTTFSPTFGPAGTAVTISGYNFRLGSTVQFNGVAASAVTFVNGNTLNATVPAGAATGAITVTSSGGTDTSYEDFTVNSGGTTPTLTLSTSTLAGFNALQGTAGASQPYAVTGSRLTNAVTITAPGNFEVSLDGSVYGSVQTLTPAIDGALAAQIYARIKSTAPIGAVSGTIAHTGGGAATQNLSVSGSVASSAPFITLSTTSLNGFAANQGTASASKTYTLTGGNLTGSITVTAPTGYEVSLNNSTFAASQTVTPAGGTLASVPVYVRLSAAAALGTVAGSVSHAGGSASTANLGVTGTVTTAGSGQTSNIYWNFETATPTSGVPTGFTVSAVSQGNNNGTTVLLSTTSPSSGYAGATAANNAGASARIGSLITGASGSAYFEFTVTPSAGASFTLTGLTFGARSTSTGPQAYTLRSSEDNYASDLAPGIFSTNSTWVLKSHTGLSDLHSSATTFRLYGYNGAGSAFANTANWRIDDLTVAVNTSGSVTPAPVITVSGGASATAFAAFSYQVSASNNPDSYSASGLPAGLTINTTNGLISGTPTVTGTYVVALTASNAGGDGTANLTMTVSTSPNAPAISSSLVATGQVGSAFDYQILASNSPTTYVASSLPAGLTIDTLTGRITGTPTTGGVANVSIGAQNAFGSDTKTLVLTILAPTISLSPATLSPFTANFGFTSASKTYNVTGTELASSITVIAPPDFEISTNGVNFFDQITLSPTNAGVSQTIYVRLRSSAPLGETVGSLIHTSNGATPKYLEITGTVSASSPTISLSGATLAPFSTVTGTPSTTQVYTLNGASLSGNVTAAAPAGFEISLNESNWADTIILEPTNGTLASVSIYVRLKAVSSVASYSGFITHTGGGAAAQNIAVAGSVATAQGPKIIASPGGSAYVGTSYTYTITTDGQQTVNSYNASGLPTGLGINASTGVISGTTPTNAGSYNVSLFASSAQGTSSVSYALRIVSTSEQSNLPLGVVVNKYQNSSTVDRVELLVTGDNVNGPPVDLRGMTIKDFNSDMASDSGGKYIFTNHPLWANVKAGTLVVLAAGSTSIEDLDASDFILRVNLSNPTYLTEASGGFDIGNTDMVIIKAAGMGADGVAGGIHALAAGVAGTQYTTFTGRKLLSTNALSTSRTYAYAVNSTSSLSDFYSATGASRVGSLTFGSGNTTGNTNYINSLRALDQTPPVVVLTGASEINVYAGSTYVEQGATAGGLTVSITGSVNTSVIGTYVLTYSAADAAGNIGTATRTVQVLPVASSPPTVTSLAAGSISARSAALNGNVASEGTSAVTVRGFVYTAVAGTPELGGSGVVSVTSGGGPGTFNAAIGELSPGATYHYRAYATSAAGTSYGAVLNFTTPKDEPADHVAAFSAGTVTAENIPATWAGTAADGYLLVVNASTLTNPTDGTPVPNDTDLSDGAGAINLGPTAISFSGFTGFIAGQTYTFQIFPFNNSGSAIDYKTTGAPTFDGALLTVPYVLTSGVLPAFSTTYGTPSSSASFGVSGTNLTSHVVVTAAAGYELSIDNTDFSNSVILTPVSGHLESTGVYVRLAATAPFGGTYNARTISVTSDGAITTSVLTAASGNGVSAKALTVIGLSAGSKTYDRSTDALVAGTASYSGLVNGESFAVSDSVSWAFADKNAGTNKMLSRTGSFAAPSSNYTIAAQPALSAAIKPKELNVSGAAVTPRAYDGSSAAAITGATLLGVLEGDTVTVSGGGSFADANVGENKPVAASLTLGGVDAANYTVTQPSLTGTISKADQTITFAALPTKNSNDAPFQLTATASSGLSVSYTSSRTSVATVSGTTVTLVFAGTTTITANQPGDANYNAAPPVAQSLVVNSLPVLLAGWDFQTTSNGGTAAAAAPNSPIFYTANFGSGSIYLNGSNGSSTWIAATTGNELTAYGGTTVNAGTGFSTATTTPAALALLGGTSQSANGKKIVFTFSMANRSNLSLTYAVQKSGVAGFSTNSWEWSTNGSTWTALGAITNIPTTFVAASFSNISVLNGASNAFLRLTFNGATGSTGNNRLDNVQISASQVAPPDTTPPVITLNGSASMTIALGSTFTDPGATASDDVDETVAVQASGTVNTAALGSYTVTYSATDAAGNRATATRTVIVADLTRPVVTINGDATIEIAVGLIFTDPGATATDNVDSGLTVSVTGLVNTEVVGEYLLTYSATDRALNSGSATRLVRVVDRSSPVITLSGAASMTIAFGTTFTDPGATASDNVDGTVAVQTSGAVNTAALGTYVITYTAADESGNTASSTRSVQVISAAAYNLQTSYGLSAALAGLSVDADKDGLNNLAEYALGRNPASASDAPGTAPAVRLTEGKLEISATVRNDASMEVVAVVSANLSGWTETATEQSAVDQTGVAAGFTRRTWQVDTSGANRQFIRLQISTP